MLAPKFSRAMGYGLVFLLAACAGIEPHPGGQGGGRSQGAGTTASGASPAGEKDHGKAPVTNTAPAVLISGSYQDRQEAELRQQLEGSGVRVQRNGETVKLIMPGNLAFAVNSEQLQSSFVNALSGAAQIIRKYDKTIVDVRGYTDSTGSFEHNQALSERRAQSVATFLIGKQVAAARIRTAGYGPRYPLAPNTSEAGRAQNRRVEINLQPM